jgi:MerR family transcriptional regulator, copper efflux regulator
MEGWLTIGQLARAADFPAKTIRYYERIGVLPAARRNAAGYRQYTQRDVYRLRFVHRARTLGLSLANLKVLAAGLDTGHGTALRPRLKAVAAAQLRAVRQRIGELQKLERDLAQLLDRLEADVTTADVGGCRCLDAVAMS